MENVPKINAAIDASAGRPIRKRGKRMFIPWFVIALLMYLVIPPLILLLLSTVKSSKGMLPTEAVPFTLQNYINVYLNPATYQVLSNTFIFAIGSLAFGFSIAITLAWLLERTDMPFRNVIFSLILIPMAIPGMLTAMVWVMLLSPRQGSINIILRDWLGLSGDGPLNIYSLPGMIFVEGINIVPTAFLMLSTAFRRMDPSLEEASAISGHGTFKTMRRIALPLIKPALLAALIFFFIIAIEAFEIPGVLGMGVGIHVFSTRIYWAMHPEQGLPDYGTASTMAMLFLVVAILLIYLYRRAVGASEKYQVITGKGYRPRRIELGRKKYAALLFTFCFLFLSVLLPILTLIWGSLFKYSTAFSIDAFSKMTLLAYTNVFNHPIVPIALKNSFFVAVVTATAIMFIVSVTSWIVVKSKMPFRKTVDVVSFLPQAIPSAVIGLAVAILYLTLPVSIYGTIFIIMIALTIRYLAYGSRTMNAAQMQIHPELEEASSTSGAGWGMTFRRIVLPLLLPAFVNGWIWVAVHAARELTASLMLYSPNSIVLPTLIWSMWEDSDTAEVCVLGLFLITVLGLITFFGSLLVNRKLQSKS